LTPVGATHFGYISIQPLTTNIGFMGDLMESQAASARRPTLQDVGRQSSFTPASLRSQPTMVLLVAI
jgi:hypothetical protein